jgi:hypothetical protein
MAQKVKGALAENKTPQTGGLHYNEPLQTIRNQSVYNHDEIFYFFELHHHFI